MRSKSGLTLVEVLVAISLLGIIGAAVIAFLPMLTTSTKAATIDTTQSHRVISIFEQLAHDWSNKPDWDNRKVRPGGSVLDAADYIDQELSNAGIPCTGEIIDITVERRRVTITCPEDSGLPERFLRAEFGNPLPEEK